MINFVLKIQQKLSHFEYIYGMYSKWYINIKQTRSSRRIFISMHNQGGCATQFFYFLRFESDAQYWYYFFKLVDYFIKRCCYVNLLLITLVITLSIICMQNIIWETVEFSVRMQQWRTYYSWIYKVFQNNCKF